MKKQYYLKVPECRANHSSDPDCICWHDEGTAPRFTTYDKDSDLSWREVPTTMSDTPRTDAACGTGNFIHCVDDDFARQLERENAELLEALDGMVKANGGVAVMPTSEAKAQNAALAFARAVIAKAKEFSHE